MLGRQHACVELIGKYLLEQPFRPTAEYLEHG